MNMQPVWETTTNTHTQITLAKVEAAGWETQGLWDWQNMRRMNLTRHQRGFYVVESGDENLKQMLHPTHSISFLRFMLIHTYYKECNTWTHHVCCTYTLVSSTMRREFQNCCAQMSFAGNAMMAVSSQLSSQQLTPVVSCLDHLIKTPIALFFLTFPKMMQCTLDSSFLIWSSCTGMWWISIHDIWLDSLAVVTCCQVINSIGFKQGQVGFNLEWPLPLGWKPEAHLVKMTEHPPRLSHDLEWIEAVSRVWTFQKHSLCQIFF